MFGVSDNTRVDLSGPAVSSDVVAHDTTEIIQECEQKKMTCVAALFDSDNWCVVMLLLALLSVEIWLG